MGAQNIANAQKTGELPADRDPQMLAAELLSGVHAVASVALARPPRFVGTFYGDNHNHVTLDKGTLTATSRGKNWMVFDHDTLRVAAAWKRPRRRRAPACRAPHAPYRCACAIAPRNPSTATD